jgi:hypothetical protein
LEDDPENTARLDTLSLIGTFSFAARFGIIPARFSIFGNPKSPG